MKLTLVINELIQCPVRKHLFILAITQNVMSKSSIKKIDIFLTVDFQNINSYFNPHDPAPLYKRLIHYKLEEYIMATVAMNKRYTAIFYKLNCTNAVDKQYAEPLMYSIQRHFGLKKEISEEAFRKFKRRNWILLGISFVIVVLAQAFLPLLLSPDLSIRDGLENCLHVFSWVILWKPIYDLIFDWNSHLKEISLYHKLASAEVIIVDKNRASDAKQDQQKPAPNEVIDSKLNVNVKSIFQYE